MPPTPSPQGAGPPTADRLRLLDGGAEAYPAMLAAIGAAREAVLLEVYHFALDGVGQTFAEALAAAARRGVRVRVLLDGWGSAAEAGALGRRLAAAGAALEVFNPMRLAALGRLRRNHRKVLAVDEEVAFVGSLNLCDEHLPRRRDGAPAWADLSLEIRGPTAAWLQRHATPWRGGRLLRGRAPAGPVRVWLSGLGGGRRLRRRYLKAIGGASRRVLRAHAYCLPDRHLVRTITAAARRGVQIRLLLPAHSDVGLTRLAARGLYRRLLAAGVEIREWPRSVLHVKVAAVDGHRLLLGSFNLDPLSLVNLEVLAEVEAPEVVAEGERWIEARLAEAKPILAGRSPDTWLSRWWEELLGRGAARLMRLVSWLLQR